MHFIRKIGGSKTAKTSRVKGLSTTCNCPKVISFLFKSWSNLDFQEMKGFQKFMKIKKNYSFPLVVRILVIQYTINNNCNRCCRIGQQMISPRKCITYATAFQKYS